MTSLSAPAAATREVARPTWLATLRARTREPPFWIVQAGVLAVTVLHGLVEASGAHRGADAGFAASVAHLTVVLYLLPVVYAGLRYGFEGGLLTGTSIAVLVAPNLFLFHRGDFAWVAESVVIAFVVGVGAVVAIPVERAQRERARADEERERALTAGRRLMLLNEVISTLVQTADLASALAQVLQRVTRLMHLDAAAVVTWREGDPTATVHASRGYDVRERDQLAALPSAGMPDGSSRWALGGDVQGALVVRSTRPLTPDEVLLLDGVAGQVGVALDNARLHREEQQTLQILLHRTTRAQEDERRRIARDLHDVATHELLLARRDLEAHPRGTGLPEEVDRARERIGGVIEHLRRFSRDLRPSVLEPLGLAPALEWLTEQARARNGHDTSVIVQGGPRRFDGEVELALYRIAEEALRNADRHADASRIVVGLAFTTDAVRLTVDDDGCGFAIGAVMEAPVPDQGGLGLRGMQERAALIGADLVVTTAPGAGTRIEVTLTA